MCVDAVMNMETIDPFTDEKRYPVKAIGILKKQVRWCLWADTQS